MKTPKLAIPTNSVGYFDTSVVGNTLQGALLGMYKVRQGKIFTTFFQVRVVRSCAVLQNSSDNMSSEQIIAHPGAIVCLLPLVKVRELADLLPHIAHGARYNVLIVANPPIQLSGGRKVFNLDVNLSCVEKSDISDLVAELPLAK